MTATHHRMEPGLARVSKPAGRGPWLRVVGGIGFGVITVVAVIEIIAALLATASLGTMVRASATVDLGDSSVFVASLLVAAAGLALIVYSLARGTGCDQDNGS